MLVAFFVCFHTHTRQFRIKFLPFLCLRFFFSVFKVDFFSSQCLSCFLHKIAIAIHWAIANCLFSHFTRDDVHALTRKISRNIKRFRFKKGILQGLAVLNNFASQKFPRSFEKFKLKVLLRLVRLKNRHSLARASARAGIGKKATKICFRDTGEWLCALSSTVVLPYL